MASPDGPFKSVELGLIELSALATLVGTTSAETLTLGLKGASGLPWAMMSFFGILDIAKVNLAAAVPYRVREAFGLHITQADLSVGLKIVVDTRKEWRSDEEPASVCAISIPVNAKHDTRDLAVAFRETEESAIVSYLYKIDRNTTKVLSVIPPAALGEEITPHFFHHDEMVGNMGAQVILNDWLALAATLVKLLEVFTLWFTGASGVWWITAIPWAQSFISAFSLQILHKGRDNPDLQQVDILSGELPSALHPGGAGKIVRGVPAALRNHLLWKFVWGIGAIVNVASVIITFLMLSGQPPKASYLWMVFQILWLIGRMVAFEVLPMGPVKEGPIVSRKWHNQSTGVRHRVMHLIFGLAKQQVTTHPRRAMFYQEDVLSAAPLANLFVDVNWTLTKVLPLSEAGIEITAVVGDTLLRSVVWVKGIQVDNSDMYDCCIVFIRTNRQLHAVPSVRVLAAISNNDDEPNLSASFDPRGTSNTGNGVQWLLWIPTSKEDDIKGWLELTSRKLLGTNEGNVLGRNELQERLSTGILKISLTGVEDIERTLGVAQRAAETLMQIVKDARVL